MGRSNKTQVVGYKYYLGMHIVLARQIDGLLAIKLATKDAWRGQLKSGQSGIDKPELFGGKQREGGFSGTFDVMDGNPAQPINDYLAFNLGALASAYRGVASLVWRRPYIGANSARLPSMEFKLLNVSGIHRGWLPDISTINTTITAGGASIYIALDHSGSMMGTPLNTQRIAVARFIRRLKGTLNSVRIVMFSDGVVASIQRSDCRDADYEALAVFVETQGGSGSGGTNWGAAVASAPNFFEQDLIRPRRLRPTDALVAALTGINVSGGTIRLEPRRKVVIFCTDGAPTDGTAPAAATLNTIPGREVFVFNIASSAIADSAVIDNTPLDGVPVISPSNPDRLTTVLSGSMTDWSDMNPAHIIRCLWTDPMRGGTASESEIGDSFEAAANLFFNEGFGLSVPFRGADSVEADRLEVERHVDAISYRSRRTGKIELKPIRNDYVPGDLPVLDSSIVLEWSGLERSNRGELPNQITVVYTRRDNGEAASVTRTNIAGVRRSGRVIPGEAVQYPFITTADLATRVCLRDLAVQDRPLLAGTVRLAYLPPELEVGEPFILNEPVLQITNVIMRVLEIWEGDGRDNSVTMKVSEDRYALPIVDAIGSEPGETPVVGPPRADPSPLEVVQEAPYYLVVTNNGQSETDSSLVTEPDFGLLLATGVKPTAAYRDITVALDTGSGYFEAGNTPFVVSTIMNTALSSSALDVVVQIDPIDDPVSITANSLALIGSEWVRVDNIVDNAGVLELTLGRGCLDTVPVAHPAGSRVLFMFNADPLDTEYIAGESVNVRLLTNLNDAILFLLDAPETAVTFNSRAIRPYPPGRFQINGSYAQDTAPSNIVLTWAHRDRTLQTTLVPEDHDDASIGPEAGTTYRVRAEALGLDDDLLSVVTDVNVGSVLTYDWPDATALPPDTVRVRFSAASVRGGYESWQRPSITAAIGLKIRSFDDLAGARSIDDGADTIRVTEDR